MTDLILGILNEEDAGSLLLSSLQSLEENTYESIGMATLNLGGIMSGWLRCANF
jgi:esterase/lipase